METPVSGGVIVNPPEKDGYVGNPQGPLIDTVYDLAKIVEVRFQPGNSYVVQAGVPFRLGLNLRLLETHLEDAEILFQKLATPWGESKSTFIDLGFSNGTGAVLSQTSSQLCFANVPEIFTQDGYNYTAKNEVIHKPGKYEVMARVRRSAEPNDFRLTSGGVYHHGLEVIADGSTPQKIEAQQTLKTGLKVPTRQQLAEFQTRHLTATKPKKHWWN